MNRTIQREWPAATSTSIRAGGIQSTNWSPRTHHGRSTSDNKQKPSPVPRTFAEFPLNRTWEEIIEDVRRLDGASLVQQVGQGRETWIRFVYMGQWFGGQGGSSRLTLTVDDSDCPDRILVAVSQHFEPLLSRHLRD